MILIYFIKKLSKPVHKSNRLNSIKIQYFRDMEKRLADENKEMSIQQKNNKEYLQKVVYTNKPTAAYFDQFNTSTR